VNPIFCMPLKFHAPWIKKDLHKMAATIRIGIFTMSAPVSYKPKCVNKYSVRKVL
jgi:hypothetical protein